MQKIVNVKFCFLLICIAIIGCGPSQTEVLAQETHIAGKIYATQTALAPTRNLANTPTQQIKPVVQPTAIKTMTHCAGAPPPRMKLGMKGRTCKELYPDELLRLRSEPGRNMDTGKDTFIMNLDQNTRFTVIGGPVCTGPYVWWQIRTRAGDEGWAAEGDNENYYMEPFDW